jgi:hypothetical protein
VHVFHVGDLTQGKAYTEHLVSTRMADQLTIAMHNMEPWFSMDLNLKTFRLVQGTGSHIFREGTSTIITAQRLRERQELRGGDVDVRELRHGLAWIDGFGIDYAHHGPSAGMREWTEGNQLRYYAKSLIMGDVGRGKTPPNLIVRGHFHEWHQELVSVFKKYEARIFLLPSFCGMGEYGRQVTGSKNYITNGLIAVEIVDGKLGRVLRLVKELDLRTEETL